MPRATPRSGGRAGCPAAVLAAILAAMLLAVAASAAAQTFTVTRTSHTILFADDAHVDPHLCSYAAYRITADAPVADVWATIGNFAGGRIGLAATDDGVYHVGAIPSAAYRMAYFYLCGDTVPGIGEVVGGQTHTLTLWDRDPSLPGATQVDTSNWTLSYAHAHINASSNKIDAVTVTPWDVYLGSTFTIRVDGRTGTVGDDEHLVFTPAAHAPWPAASFELVSAYIDLPDVGSDQHILVDELVHTGLDVNSANTPYYALYTFRVVGMTTATTGTNPYAYIDSGQNLKHVDVSHIVYPDIPPTLNVATLSKSAAPTTVVQSGSTTDVTFTVTVNNSDDEDITLDEFRDVLPAGLTYAAGTSTFNGGAIANPLASGQSLAWTGSFVVPALTTRTLVFHATLQANPSLGAYDNCATARIGATQIDTTADTTDNAPACARVTVIATPPAGGTIIVRKTAVGGGATFGFTGTGGAPVGNFSIDASLGSGVQTFTTVPAGVYTITETVPANWTHTAINCTVTPPTGGSVSPNVPGHAVAITLGSGTVLVDCEFVDNRLASITIEKVALPAAGQSFDFQASGALAPASFSLQPPGTASRIYSGLSAGSYAFTELVPAGWNLIDIECSIATAGSNTTTFAFGAVGGFDPGDTSAAVALGWGDDVRCTYYDAQNGSITLVKQAGGGDGTFVFALSGPAGGSQVSIATSGGSGQAVAYASTLPGVYAIAELASGDWKLTGIACISSNGESSFLYLGGGAPETFDAGDRIAEIHLGPGDAVTCTYTNAAVVEVPVPSLSDTLLLVLGLLLLGAGAMRLRRR